MDVQKRPSKQQYIHAGVKPVKPAELRIRVVQIHSLNLITLDRELPFVKLLVKPPQYNSKHLVTPNK